MRKLIDLLESLRTEIMTENESLPFPDGSKVVFQPPPTDPRGGRPWGSAAPPPVGLVLTVDGCRLKDGRPFWYSVASPAGTSWRVWADQIQAA